MTKRAPVAGKLSPEEILNHVGIHIFVILRV